MWAGVVVAYDQLGDENLLEFTLGEHEHNQYCESIMSVLLISRRFIFLS